ncbi:hypothetical protein TGVEG_440590 [Toxoplasma gondii VEG]|uniref:Secreted protein n=1 Tax=Toxoplasma gondii (strain ATCC 50861 / VEG) TaxID=432359 RepID=V4ZGA8_TOXGV|nr:hypothetical protein TGVEG_440590 [Toxoplasma gondii VEG]
MFLVSSAEGLFALFSVFVRTSWRCLSASNTRSEAVKCVITTKHWCGSKWTRNAGIEACGALRVKCQKCLDLYKQIEGCVVNDVFVVTVGVRRKTKASSPLDLCVTAQVTLAKGIVTDVCPYIWEDKTERSHRTVSGVLNAMPVSLLCFPLCVSGGHPLHPTLAGTSL